MKSADGLATLYIEDKNMAEKAVIKVNALFKPCKFPGIAHRKIMRILQIKDKEAQAGTTLMEVLLALAIFAIILVSVASAFNFGSAINAVAKNKILVANDARKIMEQVRTLTDLSGLTAVTDADYWKNVSGDGWLQTATFSSSSLDSIDMDVSFPEGTDQDPLHVLVTITWSEKSGARTYELHNKVTRRVLLS